MTVAVEESPAPAPAGLGLAEALESSEQLRQRRFEIVLVVFERFRHRFADRLVSREVDHRGRLHRAPARVEEVEVGAVRGPRVVAAVRHRIEDREPLI